jgi:hypothetical protein
MNGFGRRSVIVGVALAATMSAGAALAANTDLPPGFAKTAFVSPDAAETTLAESSRLLLLTSGTTRFSSVDVPNFSTPIDPGDVAALGQALLQSEETAFAGETTAPSVPRAAYARDSGIRFTAAPSIDPDGLGIALAQIDTNLAQDVVAYAKSPRESHVGSGPASGAFARIDVAPSVFPKQVIVGQPQPAPIVPGAPGPQAPMIPVGDTLSILPAQLVNGGAVSAAFSDERVADSVADPAALADALAEDTRAAFAAESVDDASALRAAYARDGADNETFSADRLELRVETSAVDFAGLAAALAGRR